MKAIDWTRYMPPGARCRQELWTCGIAVAAAGLGAVNTYHTNFQNAYLQLFSGSGSRKILRKGAMMPPFRDLLEGAYRNVWLTMLVLGVLVALHYLSFYQGSRSIYLMRRLPDAGLLHRRCWTMPLLGAVGTVLLLLVLTALFFAIYQLMIPAVCRP